MKQYLYILLILILSALSFTTRKADYAFFQSQKSTTDSSISGFQSLKKLYFNYHVCKFQSEYGDIFSDTINDIIRYTLVQGDCEIWVYYSKNGQAFRIDYLKVRGGTKSYYLIDKDKMYIFDDNSKQSWCARDTSSYKAELCLDGKKIVYYTRHGHDFGGNDRYLQQNISQKKTRAKLLEKFERVKNCN